MRNPEEFPSYPPRMVVRFLQGLRNALLRFQRRLTHPNVVLWEMVHQMWFAAGLSVAAELGIADRLGKGAKPVSELASTSGCHVTSLYRLMRMLASRGVFREHARRRFSHTRLSRALREEQVRHLILLHLTPAQFRDFGQLLDTVRTGKALPKAGEGPDLFAHLPEEEERLRRFHLAMTSASRMQVPALLGAFPFHTYRMVIDVGGGQGFFLSALLDRFPHARGILFDRPEVLEHVRDPEEIPALKGRMELFSGDFFESIPSGGDLYILKSVLHDWSDGEALKILANIRKVMQKGSRLLVIETILDESNNPAPGKMTDILMLLHTGGMERTRSQWISLLGEAGFLIRKLHKNLTPHTLIECELR